MHHVVPPPAVRGARERRWTRDDTRVTFVSSLRSVEQQTAPTTRREAADTARRVPRCVSNQQHGTWLRETRRAHRCLTRTSTADSGPGWDRTIDRGIMSRTTSVHYVHTMPLRRSARPPRPPGPARPRGNAQPALTKGLTPTIARMAQAATTCSVERERESAGSSTFVHCVHTAQSRRRATQTRTAQPVGTRRGEGAGRALRPTPPTYAEMCGVTRYDGR